MPNQINRDIYVLSSKVKDPIDYVQNTNVIPLIFHFRDFQIPSGATAQVFVQKPSGLAVYNTASISGNDVTVDVTTQMFAEVGFNKLQLQIMSGDDNLVTFVQPVNVFQNYTDGDVEESKNESNLFDQLQEAAQAANTAAEAANSAAEEIEAKAEAGDFSSTVTVGSTTTGEPGSQAAVTNSGTAQNPVLDFVIPTGAQGPQGPKGDPGSAEDIDTTPVTFEQASTRDNVASGDTVSTLFGKISKWFSDLGTAAFKGVSNVLTQTSDGYVLDARQGNVLSRMIGVLDNLATTAKTNLVAAINECAMEIGNLTALTTDEKTDLVSAINETNAGLSNLLDEWQNNRVGFPNYNDKIGYYSGTGFTAPQNCWAIVESISGWTNTTFSVNGVGVITQQIRNTDSYPIRVTVLIPLKKGDVVTMSASTSINSVSATLYSML